MYERERPRLDTDTARFVVNLELLPASRAREVAALLGMIQNVEKKFEPLVSGAGMISSFTREIDALREVNLALGRLVQGGIDLPPEVTQKLNEILVGSCGGGSCV